MLCSPSVSCELQVLSYSPYTQLHTLNLSSNNVGDEGAIQIANGLRGNRYLHFLILDKTGIGDEGAHALHDAVGEAALQALSLGGNPIDEAIVESIHTTLHDNLLKARYPAARAKLPLMHATSSATVHAVKLQLDTHAGNTCARRLPCRAHHASSRRTLAPPRSCSTTA